MLKIRRSFFVLALSSLVLLNGCLKKKDVAAPAAPKPHVTVSEAVKRTYVERFDFPGRVSAVDEVTLKARVAGFLKDRLFEEGDIVKKGQLLFTLEREPFEARVAQASADLAKAQADAKNAKLNLDRAVELRKTGNISQATVDTREADDSVAKAQVLQAQAALNLAKIDLGYTNIKAPFTGKIGLADFSAGEYLPANTSLATIVSYDPMYVSFSVSEQELLALQTGGILKQGNENLSISLQMADGSIYRYSGKINFTDVIVNEGTDTLKLRASFPNPAQQLIAGQYVTVLFEYESPAQKVLIPQASVMSASTSKYVYVVDAQNKVVNRVIQVGPLQGKDIVIYEGLEDGERVISEGIQKVRPGQEVIIDAAPAQTTKAPAAKTSGSNSGQKKNQK